MKNKSLHWKFYGNFLDIAFKHILTSLTLFKGIYRNKKNFVLRI